MSDIQFEPEEFAFLAKELRANGDHGPAYKAILSNNYNVILAALDQVSVRSVGREYVAPSVDDKELFLRVVGSILDHPSIFMGGASRQSRTKAERVWDELHSGRYGWSLTRVSDSGITT